MIRSETDCLLFFGKIDAASIEALVDEVKIAVTDQVKIVNLIVGQSSI